MSNISNDSKHILSYARLLDDIKSFKTSGSAYGSRIGNRFDTPTQKYFKILFYFGSSSESMWGPYPSGLLAPTWEYIPDQLQTDAEYLQEMNAEEGEKIQTENDTEKTKQNNKPETPKYFNYYDHNSAWSFLRLNDELERAEKLEQFITLLSDISSNSPWYFTSISGVNEALERKFTEDSKTDASQPKKLTITCLPDSYDDRISTLLDLYRDITWSWIHKKEIIPANLRKFDMAIYIFEAPTEYWHYNYNGYPINDLGGSSINVIGNENSRPDDFNINYKMIEFHDCEFNYNSSKNGWAELNNQTGTTPTHSIEIFYNDCYEYSYNDFMSRTIGDIILTDLLDTAENYGWVEDDLKSIPQITSNGKKELLMTLFKEGNWPNDYIDNTEEGSIISDITKKVSGIFGKYYNTLGNISTKGYKHRDGEAEIEKKLVPQKGFLTNAVGQVAGAIISDVKGLINKALLGNLFTYSLTNMGRQLSSFLKGDVIRTGMSIKKYIDAHNARNSTDDSSMVYENIFTPESWQENNNYHRDLNNVGPREQNTDGVGFHKANIFTSSKSNDLNSINNTVTSNNNIYSNSSIANNL